MLGDLAEPDVEEDTGWVFVPARRPLGPAERIQPELLRLADGRRLLLGYTSLAALLDALGPYQVWAMFPADALARCEREGAFDAVALNLPLPPRLRARDEDHHFPGKPEDWDD